MDGTLKLLLNPEFRFGEDVTKSVDKYFHFEDSQTSSWQKFVPLIMKYFISD
jgi:hypothetical protein